ncbi:MAG: helix-turn-helix domain-containing protein [Prolixibacteraceae bacterium]|nr:helix-turn-helix domain-containing protein [Prolixibacteraceae bacterium]
MQRALELRIKTDLTVTEIAYQVGFGDSDCFSRYFRNKINSTPKDYRMMNRKPKWT